MRPVLYVISFLAMLGLAFWAYRENYATQHQLKEMAKVQDEIAALRDEFGLERAEWAYLNRPDRLRDLTALNYDRLGLLPLEPEQFGQVDQTAYPPSTFPAAMPAVADAVDVSATMESQP